MDSSSAALEAPAVATTVVEKPAFEPYYKPASYYDANRIRFVKKSGGKSSVTGVVTTAFAIHVEPVGGPTPAGAPVDIPVAGGRGGRGGRGPAGRGGRGGRGGQPRLPQLAIKPADPLFTKRGISLSVQTGMKNKLKDRATANKIMDCGDEINALAIGMMPLQEGHHFEILFYLDMKNPEDRRLKELSDEAREAFLTYTYTPEISTTVRFSDKLIANTNGFVRTSENDESYIVLQMSTMHTTEGGDKFYPTPFTYNEETVLWNALVRHSFRAEIEFKVSHVMLVNDDKASFKTYITSCKLIEIPKLAISAEQQGREEAAEKMRQAVLKAMADRKAAGAPALQLLAASDTLATIVQSGEMAVGGETGGDSGVDDEMHEMIQKAREQAGSAGGSKRRVVPLSTTTTKIAGTTAAPIGVAAAPAPPPPPAKEHRKKKEKVPVRPPTPPPPSESEEDEAAAAEEQASGDDAKSVVPTGEVVNVTRAPGKAR